MSDEGKRREDGERVHIEETIATTIREVAKFSTDRLLIGVIVGILMVGVISGVGITLAIASASKAEQAAESAKTAVEQVQVERREAFVANCRDVNRRYTNAIKQLNELFGDAPAESIEETKALIRAIVPFRDCDEEADRIVGELEEDKP